MKTPDADIKTPDVDIKTPDVDINTPDVDSKTPDVDISTPDVETPLLEGKNLEPEFPEAKSSWTGEDCFSCCGNGKMRPQATVQAKPLKPRTEG